jgi:spermidine/putrescine transport system ATP-binding protein
VLQIELKALQEEVGITFIYVTHDQEEALTMSDRLAVMSNGRVEQVGTPAEVYERPATAYVADFLGVSNLMDVRVEGTDPAGRMRVRLGDAELAAAEGVKDLVGPAKATIRPERVRLEAHGTTGENRVPGMIDRVVYVGSTLHVMVHLPSSDTVQVWVHNEGGDLPFEQGTPVSVHLPADALRVLPDTGLPASDAAELESASA